MAKSKTRFPSLSKVLDNTPALAYLLTADFEIQYANKACAEWIGLEHEQMIGQRCVYASSELENEVRNRLQGLCPPPTIQTQPSIEATIFRQASGQPCYRKAHFTRLDDPAAETSGFIFAIAEPLDQPPEQSSNQDIQDLHLQLARLHRELNAHCSLDQLVGSSAAAERMRRQARVAIECQSDLLIVGPAGTGKAQLANIIFHERTQPEDQLVTLQGALIDREMLQTKIKEWIYEQREPSGKDWLLILDVDQLDPAAQQELYGFTQLPDFCLRIMATASRSLIEMAEQQDYHHGLAYYLSPLVIQTVALADRLEDLPMLTQAFVEEVNSQETRQLEGCSESALELLAQCRWPRNIDQLKEAVLDACQKTRGPLIETVDFAESIQQSARATRYESVQPIEIDLIAYLDSIEKELIARALQQGQQNKSKAAKLLGINRAKLLRRIAYFDLGMPQEQADEPTDEPPAFRETEDEQEAES